MTAVPEHRREPRNVPSLLSRLRQDRFTGAVEVEGGPGGTLFLHDGLVVAVESPTAPSARSLLLRSQRIDEQDWEAALAAVTESEPLASVLTGRGLITAAELFVVCTAAVFDGAFAMSLQPASGWRTDPGRVPELAARPGQEPLDSRRRPHCACGRCANSAPPSVSSPVPRSGPRPVPIWTCSTTAAVRCCSAPTGAVPRVTSPSRWGAGCTR